jgi:hypothetical protein
MLVALTLAMIIVSAIVFFSRRLFRYLLHFQEVGYSKGQFKDWIIENGVYDKKGSLLAAMAALSIELLHDEITIAVIISTIAAGVLIWLGLWEGDPRTDEDEGFQLQATKQSTAIYNLALGAYSILITLVFIIVYVLGAGAEIACYWLVVIIAIQSSPIWLVLSNSLWKRI